MKLVVLNSKKEEVGSVDAEFLCVDKIRSDIIHLVISWQRAKSREAIAHTKGISEVSGSTRKIYKQKGTGRARHGSNRRHLFVGGAVMGGPKKCKNFKIKLNKKIRKFGLLNALALKLRTNSISIHEKFSSSDGRTKDFVRVYGAGSSHERRLFIDSVFCAQFVSSVRNVINTHVLPVVGLNVLDVIKSDHIFCSEDAFKEILKRVS